MRKKTLLTIAAVLAVLITILSFKASNTADDESIIDKKVEDLIKQMTLAEKLDMLIGDSTGFDTKGNTRLGIPVIRITDGPIGVRNGKATAFPAAVAMAATWDTLLIRDLAIAMALETKAKGRNYLLGPCVGIHRMPVGGRNFESYGEDPYLSSRLAVNWIKGLQSQNVIASVKHYAMNDQEWERHNVDIIANERTMREIHLPMFEAAIKEADVWSVMAAYNLVNGQHCTENQHLLNDILKKEWGFKGFVISDWTSVYSTVPAANNGLDLEMPIGIYFSKDSLNKAIQDGKVSEETINDKVRRLIRIRFKAGMFSGTVAAADTNILHSDMHKQLALKSAQEGIVLLKNENILPLNTSKIKTIAVIGPNAKETRTGGGGSSKVDPYYAVSPFDGITKRAGNNLKVEFAAGDEIKRPRLSYIRSKYLFTPDKKSNGLFGEYFNNDSLGGQPIATRIDSVVDFNNRKGMPTREMSKNHFTVRWTGWLNIPESKEYNFIINCDDAIRLYINDKMVYDCWSKHAYSTETYKTKLEKGEYKIKLEFKQIFGGATCQLGWNHDIPVDNTDLIEQAVKVAQNADMAIIFAGNAPMIESEGRDCKSIVLPGKQDELIQAVAKVNPNTIVVLNGGIPFKVNKWINNVKGLVDMFYAGQETGNAIASILFGDVNPSGKLPFSFIADTTQTPAFVGYMDKSLKVKYDEGIFVGYRYLNKNNITPVYPFGFGLSYTTFNYKDLIIKELKNNHYSVSVNITNTGKVKGDEVVQLYVSDIECSVPRPVKELKGFSRVSLLPGETKTVTMQLNPRDFMFWDDATKGWKLEPGSFNIMVGSSSSDIKQAKALVIK